MKTKPSFVRGGEFLKLNIGDKVIIHHFINECCENKDLRIGIVINSKISDDLSYHGSSHYEEIYTVKDENGNVHEGTYGHDYIHYGYVNKIYFLTIEDQDKVWQRNVRYLEDEINSRRNKIQEIQSLIEQFCGTHDF